mmetsp:Transcript_14068/g.21932  ORF Transcript_14068/g.21932 Transcript_14068/m.21932 type:complete len:177 (+) Transcript_14068:2129-2659(+)
MKSGTFKNKDQHTTDNASSLMLPPNTPDSAAAIGPPVKKKTIGQVGPQKGRIFSFAGNGVLKFGSKKKSMKDPGKRKPEEDSVSDSDSSSEMKKELVSAKSLVIPKTPGGVSSGDDKSNTTSYLSVQKQKTKYDGPNRRKITPSFVKFDPHNFQSKQGRLSLGIGEASVDMSIEPI